MKRTFTPRRAAAMMRCDRAGVRDVRIDDVQPGLRVFDQVPDARRSPRDALHRARWSQTSSGIDPALAGVGKYGSSARPVAVVRRESESPSRNISCSLRDHVAGHPHEDVVEAAVVEVVFDARRRRPSRSVRR